VPQYFNLKRHKKIAAGGVIMWLLLLGHTGSMKRGSDYLLLEKDFVPWS
jgi:hypothetical protein